MDTPNLRNVSLAMACGLCLAALAPAATADELPTLKKGLWEFKRTVGGSAGSAKAQPIVSRECVDPKEDMKKQNEMLTKAGCKFSPLKKSGNAYSFTADCQIQGRHAQSKSIITVDNDSAYRVDVENKGGAQISKELLFARRIGDCKK